MSSPRPAWLKILGVDSDFRRHRPGLVALSVGASCANVAADGGVGDVEAENLGEVIVDLLENAG